MNARRWLALILGVGLLLRLAWSLYAARMPVSLNDPTVYVAFGRGIAEGRGYSGLLGEPTAYFPVGYPAFVGAVTWVVDHTPLASVPKTIGVVQALLGTLSLWFVWRIVRRIADERTALVAAAAVAIFPGLLLYSGTILSETLFVTLELAALTVLIDAPLDRGTPSLRRIAAFGLVTGVAALVRPQVLLFLPALVIALAFARLGWRRSLAAGGVALALAIVPIAPWTVRNAISMDAFVPISTNTGDDLCIGHSKFAYGGFAILPSCRTAKGTRGARAEVEHDEEKTRLAIRYALSHPRREAELLVKKVYYLYVHDHGAVGGAESYGNNRFLPGRFRRALELGSNVYFFAVLALAFVGAVLLARRRADPRATMVLLALLAMALLPLAFFGDPRFHVPASPLFAIAAVLALMKLAPLVRRRTRAA